MFLPSVIRLIKAVRNLWKKRVPWSKANVHTRDKYTCQYCSTKLDKRDATIDHVIPRIQGGKNSWENTVCACYDCNNKKNSRTPEQARMTLRKRPYQPTIMEFIQHKIVVDGLADLLKSIS
jgi:5-methylcytosine-specific restriction endonuclease McrA